MKVEENGCVVELVRGDITEEATDAVVAAANSRLAGGGGVDGAIHRAAGPLVMDECRKIGGCPAGSAVITVGGRLKARYVIHAVGPIYCDGQRGESAVLESAYRTSLALTLSKGLKTVAFPSISTGAYGYPTQEASMIAVKTVMDFIRTNPGLTLVRFVLFSDADLKTYTAAVNRIAGDSDDKD